MSFSDWVFTLVCKECGAKTKGNISRNICGTCGGTLLLEVVDEEEEY